MDRRRPPGARRGRPGDRRQVSARRPPHGYEFAPVDEPDRVVWMSHAAFEETAALAEAGGWTGPAHIRAKVNEVPRCRAWGHAVRAGLRAAPGARLTAAEDDLVRMCLTGRGVTCRLVF